MFIDLSPPPIEPISLDDVKLFLRIDHTHEDTLLTDLIISARQQIERRANVVMISRDIRIEKDVSGTCVRLPITPVSTLISVRHRDKVIAAELLSRTRPVRIELTSHVSGQVSIDLNAGFGVASESVPIPLRQAMLLLIADAYEHREREVGFERTSLRVDALIGPYWGLRL